MHRPILLYPVLGFLLGCPSQPVCVCLLICVVLSLSAGCLAGPLLPLQVGIGMLCPLHNRSGLASWKQSCRLQVACALVWVELSRHAHHHVYVVLYFRFVESLALK